jgi:hypothetical protein
MLISLGTENKKQVKLVAILLGAIVVIGAWEFRGSSSKPATGPHSAVRAATPSRNVELTPDDFHLRVGEFADSENIEYLNDGKDLFSASSSTTGIETPLAPPRAAVIPPTVSVVEPSETPPRADLKYLGYTQSGSASLSALFLHGGDTSVAQAGDIMFHRFRVVQLSVSSAQITDLADNRSQIVSIVSE